MAQCHMWDGNSWEILAPLTWPLLCSSQQISPSREAGGDNVVGNDRRTDTSVLPLPSAVCLSPNCCRKEQSPALGGKCRSQLSSQELWGLALLNAGWLLLSVDVSFVSQARIQRYQREQQEFFRPPSWGHSPFSLCQRPDCSGTDPWVSGVRGRMGRAGRSATKAT